MKLMFNKIDLHGEWHKDDEYPEGFTEKVPPNTNHIWDTEQNNWIPALVINYETNADYTPPEQILQREGAFDDNE